MEELILQQECQVCGGIIPIEQNIELNELLECHDCGTEYEVTSLSPLDLSELEGVEEDWGQ